MSFDYISLSDLSNLPALPIECKLTLVAIGLFFLGYVVGLIDREPRVRIDIDLGRRPTIAPLSEAEKRTAMGIVLPTEAEIRQRQEAIQKTILSPVDVLDENVAATATLSDALKKEVHKPVTRGPKRKQKKPKRRPK